MTKFISPEPNGGMPFGVQDLLQLQDGLYQGLAFLCNAVTTPFILSGCDVVSTTPTTCVVGTGWVWIEGDFRYFPGYTGKYPFYIVKDASTFSTKTFQNGTIQNALVDAFAKPVITITGNQENIPMNPGNALHYKQAITKELSDAINIINQLLPTKANKLFTAIPWTNISLDSTYVTTVGSGVQNPQYMLDEFGTVHLRGAVISDPNSTLATGSGDIGIGFLPLTITPQNDLRLISMLTYQTNYYYSSTGNLSMYSPGQVAVKRGGGDIFIGGKANASGVGVGQIRCYLELPLKSSLLLSLDGISWNINP